MHARLTAAGLRLGKPDALSPRVEGKFPVERLRRAKLPKPFTQFEFISEGDDERRISAPLFVGVTLAEAVAGLTHSGRALPEPVIASLADWALEGLKAIDEHPMGREWAGPTGLGASVDGSLMISLGECGSPLPPWRGPPVWSVRGYDFRLVGEAFKALLTWTFSPWSLLGHPSPWISGWKYAVVPEHLAPLLKSHSWADVGYLQRSLRSRWSHVQLVSPKEVALTLLAAAPEALRARASALPEEHRPEHWRRGGLEVLIDEALEQGPALARFPRLPGVEHEFDGVDVSVTDRLAVVVYDAENHARLGETILRKGANRAFIAAPFNTRRNAGPVIVELSHPAQRRVSVRVNAKIENGWLHLEPLTAEQARIVDGLFGVGT
ncbi:MAG: hypothetical protein JNM17_38590 [Archangium sp.]|nr:hypothetical protein [Archangium sp.]